MYNRLMFKMTLVQSVVKPFLNSWSHRLEPSLKPLIFYI